MYLGVSRDGMEFHLSSHHDDGTPGTAVLVVVGNIDALHAELHKREYPFFNPGISPGPGNGREMQLIDLTGSASTSQLHPARPQLILGGMPIAGFDDQADTPTRADEA